MRVPHVSPLRRGWKPHEAYLLRSLLENSLFFHLYLPKEPVKPHRTHRLPKPFLNNNIQPQTFGIITPPTQVNYLQASTPPTSVSYLWVPHPSRFMGRVGEPPTPSKPGASINYFINTNLTPAISRI
jgi:hypothetical protein